VTNEDYTNILKKLNINIINIDKYISAKTSILHKCLDCNREWKIQPKNITNGNRCICKSRISKKEYESKLYNIKLIGDFNGTSTKSEHLCLTCNKTWMPKPCWIIHNKTGCPNCNRSKGEVYISRTLDNNNIKYISQKPVNIEEVVYRFDFYIPSLDIFIEFDGIQHFKPIDYFGGIDSFKKCKINDSIKNGWIDHNKYKLIRISYNDDIKKSLDELHIS